VQTEIRKNKTKAKGKKKKTFAPCMNGLEVILVAARIVKTRVVRKYDWLGGFGKLLPKTISVPTKKPTIGHSISKPVY
jgi:hypothetical protein